MSLFRPLIFDHSLVPPFTGLFDHTLADTTSPSEDGSSGGTAASRRNGGTASPTGGHSGDGAHLSILNTLWPGVTSHNRLASGYLSPKIDLHEGGDKYKLSAELAGVPKENIKVHVDDRSRRVTISGSVRSEYDSRNDDNVKGAAEAASADNSKEVTSTKKGSSAPHSRPLISERVYGSFTRSIVLPDTVDLDNLKANIKDGVLGITIPKKAAEVAKNRTVTISDGDEE